MAVTIPATPTFPDAERFGSGLPVLGTTSGAGWTNLGQAINYLNAYLGTFGPAIDQGWTSYAVSGINDGTDFRATPGGGSNNGAGSGNNNVYVRYRIPWLTDLHTDLDVACYMVARAGASSSPLAKNGGTFTAKCVTSGGVSATQVVAHASASGDGWYQTSTPLALTEWTAGAGFAQVEIQLTHDAGLAAGDLISIESVCAEWAPLSALSVHTAANGSRYIPLDDGELDADAALSADLASYIRETLHALSERPRSLFQWSGIYGWTGNPGTDTSRRVADRFPRYVHLPMHPHGLLERGDYELTAHVYGGDNTADRQIVIQHGNHPTGLSRGTDEIGSSQIPTGREIVNRATGPDQTVIAIPQDAGNPDWYTGTLQVPIESQGERTRVRGPYYSARVGFNVADVDRSAVAVADDPFAQSVSIWGR